MHQLSFNNKFGYSSLYIPIGIFLFWFSILFFSGSLSSGYHFTDDWEVLEFNSKFASSDNNIINISKKVNLVDFASNNRFRPFFYFHKILETKLFGCNFHFWSIYTGILAVFTSLFLYMFARIISFSVLESLVFSVLSLLGPQSEIWWRLGTNETIGSFFMSLCILFMGLSVYSERQRKLYEIFFVVFAIAMTLCKESFILLIPAILFWKIWLYKTRNNIRWNNAVKSNIISLMILLLVIIAEVLFIKFFIGATKISYAGIEGFQIGKYLNTATRLSSFGGIGLILLQSIILVIFVCVRSTVKAFFNDFMYPFVLFLLILAPQVILYAKSGFYARYMIPAYWGYFVFIIYLLRFVRTGNNKLPARMNSQNFKQLNIIVLVFGLVIAFMGILILASHELDNLLLSFISLIKSGSIAPHWLNKLHNLSIFVIFLGCSVSVAAILLMINKWRSYSLVIIRTMLLFLFVNNFIVALDCCRAYAREGESTNVFLDSIIKNTKNEDLILIVADPALNFEWSESIRIYLKIEGQKNNLYIYKMLTKQNYSDIRKRLIQSFDKFYGPNTFENIENYNNIKCIAIFPERENAFLENSKSWFDSLLYRREHYGGFVVYNKVLT
ncbi:MAG: hypothetical protein ACT6FE_06110 [Methanosarcinaceae archaeon]